MDSALRHSPTRFASSRASTFTLLLSLACAAPLLGACGGGDDNGGEPTEGSIALTDDNNYSSTSALTIPTFETAPATDLTFCWSEVMDDLQCHGLSPVEDLDTLAVTRFPYTAAEVELKLEEGEVTASETSGYVDVHLAERDNPEETCALFSELSFFDNDDAFEIETEYVESDTDTFMLVLAEGTTPGVGTRTMAFLKPTAASDVTEVNVPTGCGLLEFSADLVSKDPVSVPIEGPWAVEWRDVERDSLGNPLAFTAVSSLLLAYYEGMDVSSVQDQVLDLEEIATSIWEITLTGGRTANLAEAVERGTGDFFDGFDRGEGTWLLGLMCETCSNPAPLVLVVLEPTAGE